MKRRVTGQIPSMMTLNPVTEAKHFTGEPSPVQVARTFNARIPACKSHDLIEYGRNIFATSGIN
jgi:hypothetical protein